MNDFYLNIIIMFFLWAAVSGAWNLMAGYCGLVSLGHAAYFGIGAYTTAVLFTKFGISPWIGLVFAILLTTSISVLFTYLTVRLKGPFFGLVTLAFPVVLQIIAINWIDVTNGSSGIAIPFQPGFKNFIFSSSWSYLFISFILMVMVFLITKLLHRSRLGFYAMAVRDNEEAAEALGIQPIKVKIIITALSTALTAVGGFFYTQYIQYLDPTSIFSLDLTVQIALYSIIGGIGTPIGPIIGSLLLTPLDGLLSTVLGGGPRLMIYGLVLVMIVLVAPEGIAGRVQRWRRFSNVIR